jgi:hypothetical protein
MIAEMASKPTKKLPSTGIAEHTDMAATQPPTTLDVSGVIEGNSAEQYGGLSER